MLLAVSQRAFICVSALFSRNVQGKKMMKTNDKSFGQKMTDLGQRWSKAKPTKTATFWIAIGAVVVALYLGFSRAGWVTASNAQLRAQTSAEDAVIARLAPICVAQFNLDPDKDQKLGEFKEFNNSGRRTTFVKDQGWATMPGEAEADNKVAAECADQILHMDD